MTVAKRGVSKWTQPAAPLVASSFHPVIIVMIVLEHHKASRVLEWLWLCHAGLAWAVNYEEVYHE
jgi:hypothetical protein